VFRKSGVVHSFKAIDPVLFVLGSHVLYSRDLLVIFVWLLILSCVVYPLTLLRKRISLQCLFKNRRRINFWIKLYCLNSRRRVFALDERQGYWDGQKYKGCIKNGAVIRLGYDFPLLFIIVWSTSRSLTRQWRRFASGDGSVGRTVLRMHSYRVRGSTLTVSADALIPCQRMHLYRASGCTLTMSADALLPCKRMHCYRVSGCSLTMTADALIPGQTQTLKLRRVS
jgi:hypothetical protein